MSNILHRPARDAIGETPDVHSGNSDPAQFFRLNGTYIVAPDTTPRDALNDQGCLLESAEEVVWMMIDNAEEKGEKSLLCSVMYQIQMARNLGEVASRGLS